MSLLVLIYDDDDIRSIEFSCIDPIILSNIIIQMQNQNEFFNKLWSYC